MIPDWEITLSQQQWVWKYIVSGVSIGGTGAQTTSGAHEGRKTKKNKKKQLSRIATRPSFGNEIAGG